MKAAGYPAAALCIAAWLAVWPFHPGLAEIVALVRDDAPWSVGGADGPGVLPEFFGRLARLSGHRITQHLVPRDDIAGLMRQGRADLAVMTREGDNRNSAVPLVRMGRIDMVVLPAPDIWVLSYADLHGRRISLRKSLLAQTYFDQDHGLRKLVVGGDAEAVAYILSGRADAAVGEAPSLLYYHACSGRVLQISQEPFVLESRPLWLQQSLRNSLAPDQVNDLVAAATALAEEDLFDRLTASLLEKARRRAEMAPGPKDGG